MNATSTLTAKTGAKTLQLTNTGAGSALALSVGAGRAPMVVNANAGKATNLNADKLDGQDSTAFQSKAHRIYASTTSATAGEQPAGSAGPWTFKLTCNASGSAWFTVHGTGTVGGKTSLATGSGTANTYVGAPGSIGGGAVSAVGTGAQMSQDLFLQDGSTRMELHILLTASNGGLFEICNVVGDVIAIP